MFPLTLSIVMILFAFTKFDLVSSSYEIEKNYGLTPNIQVYILKDEHSFLYATMTPKVDSVLVEAFLYLDTNITETQKKSTYAAIGFGSKLINQSDVMVLHYTNGTFSCEDSYGNGTWIVPDTKFTGGSNDVILNTGSSIVDFASTDILEKTYKTRLNWACEKRFTTIADYQEYTFPVLTPIDIIGFWGYEDILGRATYYRNKNRMNLTMTDGAGKEMLDAGWVANGNYIGMSLFSLFITLSAIIF